MVFVMILVYVLSGNVVVERKNFESMAACEKAGEARVHDINRDPDFERGYMAICIPEKARKA